MKRFRVKVTVNGEIREGEAAPRKLLADFLREDLGLTGTHVGCEHGVCGACTVVINGEAVRSCLMFAVQADGAEIATLEGAKNLPVVAALQQAFHECHALQCGFCTPGILMSMSNFLSEVPNPSGEQIRVALSGNLCRCTGYQNIVDAVKLAAVRLSSHPR
jgi:aerobic-type carbon monoxide dehydrogenase small subunit (CoxS/CutS family)